MIIGFGFRGTPSRRWKLPVCSFRLYQYIVLPSLPTMFLIGFQWGLLVSETGGKSWMKMERPTGGVGLMDGVYL